MSGRLLEPKPMRAVSERGSQLKQAIVRRHSRKGGWPFCECSKQSALEPTCLALLAIRSPEKSARELAVRFLLDSQNPNGSWPAFPGDDKEGCGLTGLALFALMQCGVSSKATERAMLWLLGQCG